MRERNTNVFRRHACSIEIQCTLAHTSSGTFLAKNKKKKKKKEEKKEGGIRVEGEEKMKEKVGKEGRVKDDEAEEEEEEESDRAEHNGAKTGKRYAHFPKKWSPE